MLDQNTAEKAIETERGSLDPGGSDNFKEKERKRINKDEETLSIF